MEQQILFALQQIGAAFVVIQSKPSEDSSNFENWNNVDYICKNHFLNGLSNDLYNVYYSYEHATDLWNALITKYNLEDAGNRKYVIENFLDFAMEDGKPISAQIDEYKFLIGELAKEEYTSKANIVETKNDGSKNLKPKKEKNFKKSGPKKKGVCFECGKPGHYKKDCRYRKAGSSSAKVNLTEADVIAAVVTEVNLVKNSKEWVLDTGATKHICGDQSFFYYTIVKEGDQVFMGNSQTSKFVGKGKVLLKLTSGKVLALQEVLHVPDIRRNLVSGALLNKNGLKLTFEADKAMISKYNVFVEKGSNANGLFILNKEIPKEPSNVSRYQTETEKELDPEFQEQRRSKRQRKETNLGDRMFTYLIDKDPVTYTEAITSPDAVFWKEAIKSELDTIIENHTWELVDLPLGTKALDSKWIFKKKLRPDGTIDKFKARLVAKGFRQKKEIDYFDTYSPVAKLSTIRTLLVIASIHKLWNDKFDSVLVTNGYKINESDKCVYSKFNGDKDMGEADVILGMKIIRKEYEIILSQSHYVENILRKFGQYDSLPVKTPLDCQGYPAILEGYSDANWISDSRDSVSTSGYVFTLRGGALS
ncbi:uncharacterized protein LOC143890870 [Tasmannia lanceolata]|uniref:uncharacterized protein LOC143890870 n=1 Tax=Tasmannia lanceolata TaxID=3420 RepID=UPI004063C125